MEKIKKQRCIIYVGDFDLRNQNVQAHLVKNNAKIFNRLGYKVVFIGVNRKDNDNEIAYLPMVDVGEGNLYLELSNTLTISGLFSYWKTRKRIIAFMDEVQKSADAKFVISYQSPTYAPVLKRIAHWCKDNKAKYIVNCADITIFNSQPLLRRIVMTANWHYLHKVNKKYMDGLIAVSRYIKEYYHKDGVPSVIIPPLFDEMVDNKYEISDVPTFVYAGTPFVLIKRVNTAGMKDRLDKIVDLCLKLTDHNVKYKLKVIGITKDLYINCVPRHKEPLNNNSDIIFEGRLSHSCTLSEVKNADFMLNIRDKNIMNEAGLSTKLVESVSLGTPVVMNSVGDSFLYLQEGVTGFKLSGNVKDDINVLKTLCSYSPQERSALKMNCSKAKTFTLDKYQEEFVTFLNEVSRG